MIFGNLTGFFIFLIPLISKADTRGAWKCFLKCDFKGLSLNSELFWLLLLGRELKVISNED